MRTLPIDVSGDEIQPWHSLGGIEHICELRKSCIVLYGIFTELLKTVYMTTDGRLMGTPDAVWSPDGRGIWIDSELRWEDEHPEARPAIYVQLSQIQRQPFLPGYNGKVIGASRFGERQYEVQASGQVTFMHVAATVGEACALADNTEYAIGMMQDVICRDFCFSAFIQSGRVPLQKLQRESDDRFASGVTFSYGFNESWDVKEECPVLKSIDKIEIEEKNDSASRQATVDRDNISADHKVSAISR